MLGTRSETAPKLEDLQARFGDHIHTTADAGWEQSRLAWNLITDQRPTIVVQPANAEDVAAVFAYARAAGLKVAAQGTGHGAGNSLGNLEGRMLLQMSRMRGVTIDPATRRARVEAGTVWDDVAAAAAPHGLAGLAGSSPNVGVIGYSLGGGQGWLGRRYGLAANAVKAVEAVLADGRIVRADADSEPELFWAIRGGGGSFAVVTAIEIELAPVATAYAGFMLWPIERASEVLHTWLEWTRDVSDDVTTCGRIMQFPPIPDVPELVRGRSFVGIDGAILAAEPEAAAIIKPLKDLGPEVDTFATVPAPALGRIHLDPEDPVPAIPDAIVVRDFDAEALDALLAATAPAAPSALLMVDIRHLGGALSRPQPTHGSAGVLGGEHLVFGVGMAMSPEMAGATSASLDAVMAAVKPWAAERQYMNLA
ncbi:MAG: FAD-binding oxidoreductase, partial [Candidatus Dormiibacterota bacterium]